MEYTIKPVAYLNKYPGLNNSDCLTFDGGYGAGWITSPLYDQATLEEAHRHGFEEAREKAVEAIRNEHLHDPQMETEGDVAYESAVDDCMEAVSAIQLKGES